MRLMILKQVKEKRLYQRNSALLKNGFQVFEPSGIFRKDYTKSWLFLNTVLTPLEYQAAHKLALLAEAKTNSLKPLNDETTIPELMKVFGISKNKVRQVLDTLFDYGVYATFNVREVNKSNAKYWILNPYLSFSGRIIDSGVAVYFSKTRIAEAYFNESPTEWEITSQKMGNAKR